MFTRYLRFLRGLTVNGWGRWGVILTTSSFVCLVLMELARLIGLVTSSYAGLVTYMLFPALFMLGLILIPVGWWQIKRRTGLTWAQITSKAEAADAGGHGRRALRMVTILTVVNIVFLMLISSRMLGFMDEARFCGTACHSVMNPEWVTYQESPHARVKCVECHVGEGAQAVLDSKLNGLWQIASVTFDLLERPIPTPVHQLRPARETCEKCHWPEKFYGTHLKTTVNYQPDSVSTPLYTTLNLKIDASYRGSRSGIHWHISEDNEVRYASVDDKREEIAWVEVRRPDGSYHRYTSEEHTAAADTAEVVRTMDCVDCHNRATHIYENPERAVDDRMQRGLIDRSLPFVKREALHALTGDYSDRESGLAGIANQINGFYQRHYPELVQSRQNAIDSAVVTLQAVYTRNVHPEMKINWGTYTSNIGHVADGGCFRCHNMGMVDNDGEEIPIDCALCHSLLADGHKDPYYYLRPVDTAASDYYIHKYQQREFLESFPGGLETDRP